MNGGSSKNPFLFYNFILNKFNNLVNILSISRGKVQAGFDRFKNAFKNYYYNLYQNNNKTAGTPQVAISTFNKFDTLEDFEVPEEQYYENIDINETNPRDNFSIKNRNKNTSKFFRDNKKRKFTERVSIEDVGPEPDLDYTTKNNPKMTYARPEILDISEVINNFTDPDRPVVELGLLGGHSLKSVGDTGAALCILSARTYRDIRRICPEALGPLEPEYRTLTHAGGKVLNTLGKVQLAASLDSLNFQHDFTILDREDGHALLGSDFFKKYAAV